MAKVSENSHHYFFYTAGTDTSRATLHWVIAFCVQYPEVQARIHKEIDEAIGKFYKDLLLSYT